MSAASRLHRALILPAALLLTGGAAAVVAARPAVAAPITTAWQSGRFVVDTPNLVRRSDIVVGRANTAPAQFVPLGNGSLGAAVWAAGGFTAQLNRVDTVPDRKSPGQLVIPGLAAMTAAADFRGYLDLYDGTLHESGGGLTLTAYLRADKPELVVDVTGANPSGTQTAQVKLWSGRSPAASSAGAVAALAETWPDGGTGGSGRTFGTLAAVTAGGRNVSGSTPNSTTAQVSFQPNPDGSVRVIAAAPAWTGGDAISAANAVLGGDATASSSSSTAAHLTWWHNYWAAAGLIKVSSADGTGDYLENLRTLYLYDAAAESGGAGLPGSQAGVADLFNFSQDHQDWFPAGYWFWNLRMQVQANLSAGQFALNDPVYRLYTGNLSAIQAWTSQKWPGKQGICVPETMRFNGNGTYNGGTDNGSCDSTIAPTWNSHNITTGAEVGLWIWQQYLMTDNSSFLSTNYPIIRDAARFLLSAATTGSDGLLHTTANAHETQWYVTDPVTDVLAMQALFPVAVKAAQTQAQEPYIEQAGVLAATLSEALVQDYDGLLRIAPAWPGDWTGEGTVAIQHNSRVSVQISGGTVGTVAIAAGFTGNLPIRSPWPGQSLTVINGSGATVVGAQSNATFSIPVQSGQSYLVQLTNSPTAVLPFAAVTGSPATAARHLSSVSIGIDGNSVGTGTAISLRAHANNQYVCADNAGASALIANRTAIGGWETFDLLDAGNGNVALRSQANNLIVTADNAGASPLITNRTAIGGWETFQLIHNGDGSVSLRALANNNYVTAENAGASALIANRTAIGLWESFDLIGQ